MIKTLFIITAYVFLLGSSPSKAAVRHITDTSSFGFRSIGENSFKQTPKILCDDIGYKLTSCDGNMLPDELCPYASNYFKSCKCNTDYYTIEEGKQLSVCGELAIIENCSDTKGTHYACRCTSSLTTCSESNEYIIEKNRTSNNFCRDNRNLETYYYPKSICQTCSEPYVVNPDKNGCSCSPEFIECDLGYEAGAESCVENGVTKYNKCKSCPNLGTHSVCPTGYICSFENCSSKFYISGCAAGKLDISKCPWMKYFTQPYCK